jgi:uncharacterized tellurite resistance protein B-like protein
MNAVELSYEEFLAYLLLYMASADGKIDEDETEFISERIGQDNYKKLFKQFQASSDYERLQIIEGFKGTHYSGSEDIEKILDDLAEIYSADGKFSQVEGVQLTALKRVLG